ncbi:SIS domain-containing protein [candidate division KSB1 bacterium]|nr:MAG: SIS domain-containing protein [candidate division KSB1 bacterium]
MKSLQAESVHKAVRAAVHEAEAMLARLPEVHLDLYSIVGACAESLKGGHKVFFCGNGGSAAESQHLATEFVVRLSSIRERKALPALALTTDTSLLTACGNDYGFDRIFARQVEAHLTKGDVLILLSTSGKSPNLLFAAKEARARGGVVVAFLGGSKTPLDELCDFTLHIPSSASQRVQEGHLMCGHLLVELVESALFDN